MNATAARERGIPQWYEQAGEHDFAREGALVTEPKEHFLIAQFSDIHCGDPRFDKELMLAVVREVNAAKPDLVIVPGDLTAFGYAEQFEESAGYLAQIECTQRIVIAGNHDCRNVGYELFERTIGPRNHTGTFPFRVSDGEGPEEIRVLAIDSNIPDLNDGQIGRAKLEMIRREFAGDYFKVFVLHHHLVSIPGTGRERNIVWDAGDVLETLHDAGVDLVVAGHKHVPYVWPIAGMLVVSSGTAATHRTRGDVPPSFNLIRVTGREITVTIHDIAGGTSESATFPRRRAAKHA